MRHEGSTPIHEVALYILYALDAIKPPTFRPSLLYTLVGPPDISLSSYPSRRNRFSDYRFSSIYLRRTQNAAFLLTDILRSISSLYIDGVVT